MDHRDGRPYAPYTDKKIEPHRKFRLSKPIARTQSGLYGNYRKPRTETFCEILCRPPLISANFVISIQNTKRPKAHKWWYMHHVLMRELRNARENVEGILITRRATLPNVLTLPPPLLGSMEGIRRRRIHT